MSTKRVLVTGASEGIGRAFALRLAQEGYDITAVARNEARLKELLGELPPPVSGGSHSYIAADLATAAGVESVAAALREEPYDLLINNAGVGVYGKFYEQPLPKLQEMLRINCEALVALSHAFLKNAKSGDALLNVSSTSVYLPPANMGLYAATKAFITSFSETLWYEQGKRGIYVVGLCPGLTQSRFEQRAGMPAAPAAIVQSAEQVVDEAMAALRRRRQPTAITGFVNRLMVFCTRLIPRKALVKLLAAH